MYKRFAVATIMILGLFQVPCAGGEPASELKNVTFRAMDLWIDSGEEALAAYQVDVTYDKAKIKIVGLEGGGPDAYVKAPYFDRKGFEAGRIIVAAFTTDKDAPKGRIRVARIHVAVEGRDKPQLVVKLVTAAKPGGERTRPTVELTSTPQQKRIMKNGGE